jgi:hypothetical protein
VQRLCERSCTTLCSAYAKGAALPYIKTVVTFNPCILGKRALYECCAFFRVLRNGDIFIYVRINLLYENSVAKVHHNITDRIC